MSDLLNDKDVDANGPVVSLKGNKGTLRLPLRAPASMALRYEITYAVVQSEPRAVAAALGISASKVRKHVPWNGSDILPYGQLVIDWLLSEGVGYFDVLNGGRVAWKLVSEGLIPEREVSADEDFSEAGGESTS